MIRNEANKTEAGHCAFEIYVLELLIHLLRLGLSHDVLGTLSLGIWLNELSVCQRFTFGDHDGEFAIAVVDELDEGVVCGLACRAVVQEHLQEVNI